MVKRKLTYDLNDGFGAKYITIVNEVMIIAILVSSIFNRFCILDIYRLHSKINVIN